MTERARLIGAAWLEWGRSVSIRKGRDTSACTLRGPRINKHATEASAHRHRISEDSGGKGRDGAGACWYWYEMV